MRLILKYLKNYKRYIFFNLLGIWGFAAAELGIPTMVSKMIDYGIAANDIDYIYRMGGLILLVSLLGGIGTITIGYCSSRTSTAVIRDLRNDIIIKSQDFSHSEYNKFGISSMITRTVNDAYMLMQFINTLFRTALLTPVMIAISIVMVVRTSLNLSMIIGATIPIICLLVFIIAKLSNPISARQQQAMDTLNRVIRENLAGIRIIRAFRKDPYEHQRFSDSAEDYAQTSKKLFKLMSIGQPLFFLLLDITIIIVFYAASHLIHNGSLQIGQLVAFQEYLFHAMYSMLLFSLVFLMYPRAVVSARRIQELLNEEPNIKEPEYPVFEGIEEATLSFDHVTFQYPDGEIPVLHDISFDAKKGDTIAFIGSTGSGKSTLINLIPRLYDITAGCIKVDGVDIRNYSLKTLREKIGFIPQKALLFRGSIEDNIRYGKHDAHQQELEHSAKIAQAYQFIMDKPEQFEEPIEEGGSNMSGGQKQRLSIARAIVRKPEIYIFDDSFSALDYKTDASLRKKLKEETRDAITLIVAQRITSIMDATKIIVLNDGLMVGAGTHHELLRSCQIYQEIAESQLSQEELNR